MSIQLFTEIDKSSLLFLNDSDSLVWDGVMWIATNTKTWIPAAIVLLYVIFRNNSIKQALTVLLMLALTITLADQIASSLCKPYFARMRPTQDSDIMYLVNVVNGYRGGRYGFISSHAANTFAIATFVSLLIRNLPFTVMMFLWTAVPSYSRIYLGVHYPGDILFGALEGCIVGILVYMLFLSLQKRFFTSQQYVSIKYTSTGYKKDDLVLLHAILLLTYLYGLIAGMCVTRTLYL